MKEIFIHQVCGFTIQENLYNSIKAGEEKLVKISVCREAAFLPPSAVYKVKSLRQLELAIAHTRIDYNSDTRLDASNVRVVEFKPREVDC